jgi:hypothetical protein
MRLSLLAVAAVLALVGPAAGCSGDDATPEEIIGNWVAATGISFSPCGTVEGGQCGTWTPTVADEAALTCFVEGLAACQTVRLTQIQPTLEGDPLRDTFLVLPAGGGTCRVVHFRDTTEDAYGPQLLYRYDCPTATLDSTCHRVAAEGCGEPAATW